MVQIEFLEFQTDQMNKRREWIKILIFPAIRAN